jgi:hypothetical protein
LAEQPCLPHDASYFRSFYHGQMGKALEVIEELPSTTSRPSAKRHTAPTAPAPPWTGILVDRPGNIYMRLQLKRKPPSPGECE